MNDRSPDSSLLAPCAADLARLYRPGAGVFATPGCSLLTQGVHASLPQGPSKTLAARAIQLLDEVEREGHARPVLIGAVPFNADAPTRLFVPEGVVFGHGGAGRLLAAPCTGTRRLVHGQLAVPTPLAYRHNVEQALRQIRTGALEKVVLSRSLAVCADIDMPALLRRLIERNPLGYSFAIDLLDPPQAGRTLMGASPELLLSRRGRRVVSHPLAGSIPRSPNPEEDRARSAALLHSTKDLHEHQLVVSAVAETLRPHCSMLNVPEAPSLVATPTMWHLGTRICGDLAEPGLASLELAMLLHPTPAVCGHPAVDARHFIEETEGFDRGFFAGLVGWCDVAGDGDWAVTIRCAEVDTQSATLYAGAGIVIGSDPEAELRETTAKLGTMLNAMELELALEGA